MVCKGLVDFSPSSFQESFGPLKFMSLQLSKTPFPPFFAPRPPPFPEEEISRLTVPGII